MMGKCWKTNCSATERWWYANGKIIIAQANTIGTSNRAKEISRHSIYTVYAILCITIHIAIKTISKMIHALNSRINAKHLADVLPNTICLVWVFLAWDLSCSYAVLARACVCVCLNTKMCSFEWEKFEERLHPKNDDIKAKQKPCCSFRTAFHLYCFPTVYGSMGVCMCLVNGKLNRESFHHSMCRAMPFAKVEQFLFGFLLHACETNNRIVKWSKLCEREWTRVNDWMNEREMVEKGAARLYECLECH